MINRDQEGCRNVWAKHLVIKVEDAMGLFCIPAEKGDTRDCKGVPPLNVQYETLRKKYAKRRDERNFYFLCRSELHPVVQGYPLATEKARNMFENGEFEGISEEIGYGGEFVDRVFKLVQEAISYEKRLYEEFKL